jgi:glycosyltransferase involved in cell wall biosynthesis
MKPNNNRNPSNTFPLVAIGVPVFNGEKYLEECLNSILIQTYTNWECVIVNNRSTDASGDIVRKFESIDSRFKLVDCSEFVGLVENWNRVYTNISKDSVYLKVIQADDWIYPEAIEQMVDLMEKYPSAGFCTSYRINGKKVGCDGLHFYDGPLFSGTELLKLHLRGRIDISGTVTTPLFRISVLKLLPTYPKIFDENEYHIDTRIVYELMHLADIVFVFKVLSYTRWHDDAETMTIATKYNTFLNGKYQRLSRFSKLYPEFRKDFNKHKNVYAYFLLKEKIKGHKKAAEWHNKYLGEKFTFLDYAKAAFLRNGITFRILSLFGKN